VVGMPVLFATHRWLRRQGGQSTTKRNSNLPSNLALL